MDMSEAFEAETRAHCPQIRIVQDLSHVVAKFAREVIDRIRVEETNRIAPAAGRHARAPPRDQGGALANAAKPAQPRSGRADSPDGPAAGESAAQGGLRAQGCAEGALELPLPRGRTARVGDVVWLGRAPPHSRVGRVCAEAQTQAPRPPRALSLSLAHRTPRRDEQQDHSLKRMAYGDRDDTCFFLKIRAAFPRKSVKNLK